MFQIHPADLERRRSRCRPVIENLSGLARESTSVCNVCGSTQNVILANQDRYGFSVRTAMCLRCGLLYMMDRFTPEAYHKFYGTGAYRALSCGFNGTAHRISGIQLDQLEYAAHAISVLDPYVRRGDGAKLLDVGGSTGVVAGQFADHFELAATVLDPAVREIAAARALGLEGVIGSVETYETQGRYDVVLLCRSVEHLSDVRGALVKIRELLNPGGVFYCDVVDYLECCRMIGPPQVVSKMDHCFWLCQETAPAIFAAAGFEIVSANVSFESGVVGYVLRPADPVPIQQPNTAVHQILRRLREIDGDWRRMEAVPHDLRHRVRRIGYRFKRHVRRTVMAAAGAVAAFPLPDWIGVRSPLWRNEDQRNS